MSAEHFRALEELATLRAPSAVTSLRAAILAATCVLLLPASSAAQYTLAAENGDTLQFESAALRAMLDTARALYADLQEDPRVVYYTPLGRETVSLEDPEASYPWNVVTVLSDSAADVQRLPANLREADRAYYSYAVQRMRVVRGTDPDVPCDSILALEEKAVDSFTDGWIVSRTLFGGPPFPPLDALVFARRAGLLRALLARHNDPQVGACAGQWAEENPERVAAYDAWREQHFPVTGEIEGDGVPEAPDPEAQDTEATDTLPSADSSVPAPDTAGAAPGRVGADPD